MSRRLTTVLRVAALQETVARAQAGRSRAALANAVAEHGARLQALADGSLPSGSPAALQQARSLQVLRARAVGVAEQDVAAASQERAGSVERWTAARRRSRLLQELADRLQAEAEAVETATAQRLADDLSAGRHETRGRR